MIINIGLIEQNATVLTSENVESTIYCATGMRCKYLLLLWLVISLLTQDILLNHDPGTLVLNSE